MTATQKTALVTGGTSGIGKAITLALSTVGYEVTALGRDPEALAEMQAIPRVDALAVDLRDRDAIADVVKQKDFDVLVNNAGVMPPPAAFDEMSQSDIDTTLDINLSAAIALTRTVLPAMLARETGHIVFTGSTAGQTPFPNMAVYGATKAALSSFAAALRCDLSGSGIRVTEIVAGRVQTALYRDALSNDARDAMYEDFEAVRPEDVARMLISVLNMPSHVDVTRFDILPTAQFVGGGGFGRKED